MGKILPLSMLLGMLFCHGCAHTRILTADTPPADVEQIRQNLAHHRAVIYLTDGVQISAAAVDARPGRVGFTTTATGEYGEAEAAHIEQIAYRCHGRGASDGLELGLILAVPAALVAAGTVAALRGDDSNEGLAIFAAVVVTLPLSPLAGLVAGFIAGSRMNIRFRP